VNALLAWIEGSTLGVVMRGSGVWTYGLVNLVHILGISSLFGSVLVLDLRLLGLWRDVPVASLGPPLVRVAFIGLCVAALSGVCLIATNGSEYSGNPFLPIKLAAIAAGVANAALLGCTRAWRELGTRPPTPQDERRLAIAGGVSLVSWILAVGAGRMIGYW
jgi:hypothetical protein